MPSYMAPTSSAAIGALHVASPYADTDARVETGMLLGHTHFPWRSGSIVGVAFGAQGYGVTPPETDPSTVLTVLDVRINGNSLWSSDEGRPRLRMDQIGTFSVLPPSRSRALKYGDLVSVVVLHTSGALAHTLVSGAVAFHGA